MDSAAGEEGDDADALGEAVAGLPDGSEEDAEGFAGEGGKSCEFFPGMFS